MRSGIPLALLAIAACTERRAPDLAPLAVRVHQAQTTPSFTHAVLKVYRDDRGRAGVFLRSTGCLPVDSLPRTAAGRRRLEIGVEAGGPYYLQFTGHNDPGCPPNNAVAAGLVPGVVATSGRATLVPIFAAPVDRFARVEPPPLEGAEVAPRAFHSATVADDGSVVVAGGAQDVVALGSGACAPGLSRCLRLSRATSGIHRIDPGSGAMVLIGALDERRFLHTATAMPGGRIAFAGGAQAATLGGSAASADAPLLRPDPLCTNPNDAAGAGCILRSLEVHRLDGSPPQTAALTAGRAGHAAVAVGAASLLVAGGRQSAVQIGCTSDAQCAPGAACNSFGRCIRDGQECGQVANVADVCLPDYTCDRTAGKCVKRGCATAEDCGGCLASGGCTGTPSTCEVATGTCTRRGCSSDSECLGSNRRCVQGNCVQVGCDSLSGCPAGRVCDVRSGKCAPEGVSVDCSTGACDCRSDAECAPGFSCQTSGELAGRCVNTQVGCPATVCRRDVDDPAQGPYFDPETGALRRDVNCQGNQCVLTGCLADVDCAPGFLCIERRCVNGRRVTTPSRTAEVCDLGATPLPATPCAPVPDLATPREGLAAGCVTRGNDGACTTAVLWGGNADPAEVAELRTANGSLAGPVSVPGCPASDRCTPAYTALAEVPGGVLVLGGASRQSGIGGARYTFLSVGYRLASGSRAADLLPVTLGSPRVFAATVFTSEGVIVLGGATDGALSAASVAGRLSAAGDQYSEPSSLRLSGARFGHSATVLRDGRIVVVGGIDPAGPTVLSSVEVYVPSSILR